MKEGVIWDEEGVWELEKKIANKVVVFLTFGSPVFFFLGLGLISFCEGTYRTMGIPIFLISTIFLGILATVVIDPYTANPRLDK